MENFINFFIWPILTFIIILFIFLSLKAIKYASKVAIESQNHSDLLKYTNITLSTVQTDLKSISETIDKNLLPDLKAVYKQLPIISNRFSNSLLKEMLKSIGYTNQIGGDDDKSPILFGIEQKDFKISFFSHYDKESEILNLYSFAFLLDDIDKSFLLEMLKINSSTHFGTIGIREIENKYLMIIDESLLLAETSLNCERLNTHIVYIKEMHQMIYDLILKSETNYKNILFSDYTKLIVKESATGI